MNLRPTFCSYMNESCSISTVDFFLIQLLTQVNVGNICQVIAQTIITHFTIGSAYVVEFYTLAAYFSLLVHLIKLPIVQPHIFQFLV